LHRAKAVHDQVHLYQCECNDGQRDPTHGCAFEPVIALQKQCQVVKGQRHLRNENPVVDGGIIHAGGQVTPVQYVKVHGIQNDNANVVAHHPEHCKQEKLEIYGVVGNVCFIFCEVIHDETSHGI
jgi:hypothetical protein